MKNVPLADTHIHSIHSFDGHDSIADIAAAARSAGFSYIAITDHFECGKVDSPDQCEIERIRLSVRNATLENSSELRVLRGLELGQPQCAPEQAAALVNDNDYDYIIGSVHYINDGEDFYWFDYKEVDASTVYDRYINDVLLVAQTCEFDSLAHLTYPLRYMILRDGAKLDISDFADVHDAIFEALVKRGKALEINTKLIGRAGGFFTPDADLLKRFRELGGKYVTLGSDAHSASVVGGGIREGIELLRECGFDSYVIYENRLPTQIRI